MFVTSNANSDSSEAGRARRQAAVDFARGNLRLEGFVLDDAAEAVAARFIEGKLTCAEMLAALQTLVTDDDSRSTS